MLLFVASFFPLTLNFVALRIKYFLINMISYFYMIEIFFIKNKKDIYHFILKKKIIVKIIMEELMVMLTTLVVIELYDFGKELGYVII